MGEHKLLFSPIKTQRTFEKVSIKIKQLILDGVLTPGERLPSETELAQQFHVSRQTVREALRILELSGFITIHKGGPGGPVVRNTILNSISNLYLDAFQMERISLEDITIVRWEVESAMLPYAIQKADEEDIRALEKNIENARRKIEENGIAIDENIEFHNLLARSSKNHVFVIVVASLMAVVREMLMHLTTEVPRPETPLLVQDEKTLHTRNTVEYHQDILNSIKKRDVKKASRLLREHLEEVGDRLKGMSK